MHGQFVWYDLITSDPAGAQRYYPAFTGWKTQKFDQSSPDMPYTMWTLNGEPIGGVGQIGREQAAMGVQPHWLPSVHVNNIDESVRKVTSLGGKVVHGPDPIPGMGRYAIIQDPQGATLSVYQSDGPTSGFDGTPSVGRFSWNELMTTDFRKAFDFYRQLFGWEQVGEAMDMGGGNMYLMYGTKGKMFGGIYNRDGANMPNMPPNWLPYVYVKDIKQTVDAATRAGGKLGRGPMDIPGGGKIAILADPQGARFALHQGASQTAAKPKAAAAKPKAAVSKPKAKAITQAKAKKAKARPKARAKTKPKKPKSRPRAKAKSKKKKARRR
jgi:predicted enzyme related to lactoylglutathione lyase